MLYVPGYGEAAISMSSDMESADGLVIHTIRHVGNVTKATSRLKVGDVVGLRGPFGSSWPLEAIQGMDVVIACGGIGLPPLRGAIYYHHQQPRQVWQGHPALWRPHPQGPDVPGRVRSLAES